MICPPYALSRPDRYCRLLPPFVHPGDPERVDSRLRDLAETMFASRTIEKMVIPAPREGNPAAAYTYFGQFIMHDLTFDDTPFRSAGAQEPEETTNLRTPRLDLDSMYGDGPFSRAHQHLYDGIKFRIGQATNHNKQPFDVPILRGFPALVDERNCENVILRQIHAMFLLFHNVVVARFAGSTGDKWQLFEKAQKIVRWHFQWLVRTDFLDKVCDPIVYDSIIAHGQRVTHWPPGRFSIPVEFSQAAARFGHSMVRSEYQLKENGDDIELGSLFGGVRRPVALDDTKAVEWAHFVNPRQAAAEAINTSLVSPFRDLPDDAIDAFVSSPIPHEPHMLAVRTLCRGASTRLPTGQQLRVALDPKATIRTDHTAWANARAYGFGDETPLWYYLLLEAEIEGEAGEHLGKIGSRIVAEVIDAALHHDSGSFLHEAGGEWKPLTWPEINHRTIEDLSDLAAVVELERYSKPRVEPSTDSPSP